MSTENAEGSEVVCVAPECVRRSISRGLCRPCYEAARRLVKEQRTTWEVLAERGLCVIPEERTANPLYAAFIAGAQIPPPASVAVIQEVRAVAECLLEPELVVERPFVDPVPLPPPPPDNGDLAAYTAPPPWAR